MERVLCPLCKTRRPRRFCPGIEADICAQCCGTEREQTIPCPLECPYLQEARRHQELPDLSVDDFPNADIEVTEEFLQRHEALLLWISVHLLRAALETPGIVDGDLQEALEALVKTYRALQSGLLYEVKPANPLAAAVVERVQASVEEYRRRAKDASGTSTLRDAEVLGILAFLQRMEIQQKNGRRLGRAFVDFLRMHFPQSPVVVQEPSLLV